MSDNDLSDLATGPYGADDLRSGDLAIFVMQTERADDGQYIACIARRDEPGFYRTDWRFGTDWDIAREIAREKNARMGLNEREAEVIQLSTMGGTGDRRQWTLLPIGVDDFELTIAGPLELVIKVSFDDGDVRFKRAVAEKIVEVLNGSITDDRLEAIEEKAAAAAARSRAR